MKVLIFGAPKSGTSILHQRMLLGLEKTGVQPVSVFEPCSRRRSAQGWDLIKSGAAPVSESEHTLVKALWVEKSSPTGIPGHRALALFGDYDHKIFLFRDPRDRLISQFFYRWFHLAARFSSRFMDCVEQVRRKESAPDALDFHELCRRTGVFQPVWTWPWLPSRMAARGSYVWELIWRRKLQRQLRVLSQFAIAARQSGWSLLRYEDLVDGRIEAIEQELEFQLPQVFEPTAILRRVARSEGYGSWRRWFNAADETHFRPIFDAALAALGYDPSDWRLDRGGVLSPDEGSRYLTRLAQVDSKRLAALRR